MTDADLPVIVGVGEVVGDRSRDVATAREPLALIADAIAGAAADSGAPGALADVDAVYAVRTSSWNTAETAARIASDLAAANGAAPRHLVDTTVGGHWPTRLLEQAAARIADGQDRMALLVGGEAQAAVTALQKAGIDPVADLGWSAAPGGPPAFDLEELGAPAMRESGVILPTRVYPLFQHALQADLGLTPAEGAARSAEVYAALSAVAAANPIAWNPVARSAEDIATVGPANRMVCEPYPLAVNAMPHVDMAAAVLVMSASTARAHGIPEDRWVHIWGGAGATDTPDVLARPSFDRAAALELAIDRALAANGLAADDLDLIDVYSCFPVVPELVARHLGGRHGDGRHGDGRHGIGGAVLSATGGHAAFGGPLSSYSVHAICSATRRLRGGDRLAAVHANGGYLTHQHVIVLGRSAPPRGYVGDPEPTALSGEGAPPFLPAAAVVADGPAPVSIETWTVEHGRDGQPAQAIVVARTATGERTAATTAPGDAGAAALLSVAALPEGSTTHIGRTVRLVPAGDGTAHIDPTPIDPTPPTSQEPR